MAIIVAGIDEAGYGPLLGPMVVSCSAFSVPEEYLQCDLWKLLSQSVAKSAHKLSGRVLITDSKKAYKKREDIRHLKRTVLSCLGVSKCGPDLPKSTYELICRLAPDCCGQLSEYPWYENISQTAIAIDADTAIAGEVLQQDLREHRIELIFLRSRFLDVCAYNSQIQSVRNKARVLFGLVCGLLQNIWDICETSGQQVCMLVDRQGGRVRYHEELLRMFGDFSLKILSEQNDHSSYELARNSRKMRIHFITKADDKYLPVSLASMASKLLRELSLKCLNSYFTHKFPGLKPTAGYWQDGLRFVNDLTSCGAINYSETEKLIRCR